MLVFVVSALPVNTCLPIDLFQFEMLFCMRLLAFCFVRNSVAVVACYCCLVLIYCFSLDEGLFMLVVKISCFVVALCWHCCRCGCLACIALSHVVSAVANRFFRFRYMICCCCLSVGRSFRVSLFSCFYSRSVNCVFCSCLWHACLACCLFSCAVLAFCLLVSPCGHLLWLISQCWFYQ